MMYKKLIPAYIKIKFVMLSFLNNTNESIFYDYDKRGVRAFVRYSTSNGKWFIECYRKKKKEESKGEHDWQMIREGNIQTYNSRQEAEKKSITIS